MQLLLKLLKFYKLSSQVTYSRAINYIAEPNKAELSTI